MDAPTISPERERQRLVLEAELEATGRVPCRTGSVVSRAIWTSDEAIDQQNAAERCGPCPLLAACRTYGLAWPAELGVYGGLTETGRRGGQRRTPASSARRRRRRTTPLMRVPEGPKACTRCGEMKAPGEFRRDARKSDGRRPSCRACDNLARRGLAA
ncbi:WhiB family transcriptional regulator [Isoptericola sp. NPDC056618]|uniref:WhiB family transcriptional regulator n=1 Tax=Isoptericola sp. NPDC056618 TaxID=3345878 RepID=UPI00368F0F72